MKRWSVAMMGALVAVLLVLGFAAAAVAEGDDLSCPDGCAMALQRLNESLSREIAALKERTAALEEEVYRPGLLSTGSLDTVLIESAQQPAAFKPPPKQNCAEALNAYRQTGSAAWEALEKACANK